jgi:hypothetical protein
VRIALRQRCDRQEDHAAGHDPVGAGRIDLLGSGAVHSVRHSGRPSRCRTRTTPTTVWTRARSSCC